MKKLLITITAMAFIGCTNSEDKIIPPYKMVDQCGDTAIQMNPGDTIIFRRPNIPAHMNYNNANFNNYYSGGMDSCIVTYHKCD